MRFTSDGRPLLLDLADSPVLRAVAAGWGERVAVHTLKPESDTSLTGLLVRPDGYIAWASDAEATAGLAEALGAVSRPRRVAA